MSVDPSVHLWGTGMSPVSLNTKRTVVEKIRVLWHLDHKVMGKMSLVNDLNLWEIGKSGCSYRIHGTNGIFTYMKTKKYQTTNVFIYQSHGSYGFAESLRLSRGVKTNLII